MLSTLSNMKIKEMYQYWNLGYGMCLIVDPKYNKIGTVIGKIL
jgi:phosphoribosylaminoimidazole (AIR) synthetase